VLALLLALLLDEAALGHGQAILAHDAKLLQTAPDVIVVGGDPALSFQ